MVAAPATTQAPSLELLKRRLAPRQDDTTTCGWALTDPTDQGFFPLICDPGYLCANNADEMVEGCCPNIAGTVASNCVIPTTCLDSTAFYDICSASGTDFCQTSLFNGPTGACTDQIEPYCAGVVFGANSFSTFICHNSPSYLAAGYFGSTPPVLSAPLTTTPPPTTTPPSPSNTEPVPSSTSPVPTPVPGGSTTGGLSTGAIVGIAVAGTVVLLGAFILVFAIYRQKQKKAKAELTRVNILEQQVQQQRSLGQWASEVSPSSPGTLKGGGEDAYQPMEHESTVDGTVYKGMAPNV